MRIFDTAIIGAGPVGLFTIFQAGMNELDACIIDSLSTVGGQCSALYAEKPIYDIAGFHKITAQDLINNLKKQIAPFSYETFLNQTCEDLKYENGLWQLQSEQNQITAKTIIIAAGAGSFEVRKPPVPGLSAFENKSVFYHVTEKSKFKDKIVTIVGGGDSALDWAVLLADGIAKKVNLVHRRDNFRALQKTVSLMKVLQQQGKIDIITPCQLTGVKGNNGYLTHIDVKNMAGEITTLKSDYLLPFFGMTMNLGAINNWGLKIIDKHIEVDPASMETCLAGVFAIGDICFYPGKLKFISTGFAEAARAIHSAYDFIHPGENRHFEHSTTKGIPNHG